MQGSIDARSSKPPVKEDEVDHDKGRESAEKRKSAMDLKKKKEKKKNLERQALETRRAKSRQRGEPEEESPDEAMMTMTATTPRGWRPVLTGSSRVRLRPTSMPRGREPQRGAERVSQEAIEGVIPTPLPC